MTEGQLAQTLELPENINQLKELARARIGLEDAMRRHDSALNRSEPAQWGRSMEVFDEWQGDFLAEFALPFGDLPAHNDLTTEEFIEAYYKDVKKRILKEKK